MGKFLLMITTMLVGSSALYAQYAKINIDMKAFQWVTTNTATQMAMNEAQNIQIDSIRKKQNKLMALIEGISTNASLIEETYRNVSGFKKESRYYISMFNLGSRIIDHSVLAYKAIENGNIEGKTRALLSVSNLVADAISLGTAFSDIVTNGKVSNPIKHPDAMSPRGDGYNFLNRHQRLIMANDIIYRLKEIDHQLVYITYIAQNSKLNDLLRTIDRKGYVNLLIGKGHINDIIGKWNKLTE